MDSRAALFALIYRRRSRRRLWFWLSCCAWYWAKTKRRKRSKVWRPSRSLPFRMCEINVDIPVPESMTVHFFNGLFNFRFLRKLDEGKRTSTQGNLLVDDLALNNFTIGTEGLPQLLLRGFEREVSNENVFFHTSFGRWPIAILSALCRRVGCVTSGGALARFRATSAVPQQANYIAAPARRPSSRHRHLKWFRLCA